ncbi:WASH complex subunit FAM21 isoform X1 [Vespula squamosa]|uniref:WASH complex subunit FAM21 isoform X1 n=1 Tax=Vespula squamosa TaxID=30214 RepID=A0ABD1ZU54_VESSQ
MFSSNVSDEMEKSWERSWTTEEMRNKRQEWSLAADAGLLKHLQQFSENLVSKANKTQQAIDSLTTQLSETAIIIDNVTNTSLALANTQFIESRVQEDDIEIEKKIEDLQKDSKEQELSKEQDLIASISESIKQGLSIMDEKYKRMEVIDSDSEDEDDARFMSVILGPFQDPYQDRPLPYVIGSDIWNTSNKIGLESSSSESEQADEEEDESESDKEEERIQESFDPKNDQNINTRLSSSLSESEKSNDASYVNHGKLDSISQNTMSFASDSTTPIKDLPKIQITNETPNFAEELAKRLGSVRQAQKPPITNETREPSINKFKEDLFTPEHDGIEDFFNDKPNNLFDDNKEIFKDNVSTKLWEKQPVFQSNIIPPSMDVPPPISTISMKPKSAIDDLFADGDSEDSDDIFSSKQPVKRITKDTTSESKQAVNAESVQKKFLDVVIGKTGKTNWTTSTPESNVDVNNLFSEEEEDDNDLFATSKKQSSKPIEETQNLANSENNNKKKPVDDLSILGGILTSSIENTLSSRVPRRQSSDSSNSDTEGGSSNELIFGDSSLARAGNSGNWNANLENSGNSSGISIQRHSISSTTIKTMSTDDVYTSTRLNSEELYRERFISDSLFAANTLHPPEVNSTSLRTSNNQSNVEQTTEISTGLDDVFENKDLFGPPPLPKADSKTNKSKINSLFDESDSGDELFSTTSSGSRSQKSTDFLATTPQYPDKNKSSNRKGLFDEDIDIFGNKDSPDVDIFGNVSKPYKDNTVASKRILDITSDNFSVNKIHSTNDSRESNITKPSVKSTATKKSLFDDEEDDNVDLFGVKNTRIENKIESQTFATNSGNDLFSTKQPTKTIEVIDKKSLSREEEAKVEDVKHRTSQTLSKKTSEGTAENFLATSKQEDKRQDNQRNDVLFEDDDYEDLFANNKKNKIEAEVESKIENIEESNQIISKEESTQVDVKSSDNFDDDNSVDIEDKKHPPTTLNIRTTTSSLAEDNSQVPRRAVSGKIKDLMGKMGDLKILSPTDTPPLWRKSEEKTDEEDEVIDRDSDDGGCISTQIRALSTEENEPNRSSNGNSNAETAISFDIPVQVETLLTASKSRVRIQAKRRPQSRHARKSALRQSGLDFDTIDTAEKIPQDENSDISKESSNSTSLGVVSPNADRLNLSSSNLLDNVPRNVELNPSIADDKSELGSISKESSISVNKNTLLSPSTDEEDLFDVPPDLPEDPQREDTLFGRAPILSPIQNVLPDREPTYGRPLRDTIIGGNDENEKTIRKDSIKSEVSSHTNSVDDIGFGVENEKKVEVKSNEIKHFIEVEENRFEQIDDSTETTNDVFEQEYPKGPIDPLRDNSYDPLKDPSQLFAFVTKTPSPDKGKDLLFSDDDSLFSSGFIKPREDESLRKHVSDLFADDASGDLFSVPLTKSVKKPLKDTKINFFDKDSDGQNDEDDNLFDSITKKVSMKNEEQKNIAATKVSQKKINFFQDDDGNDDDDVNSLFAEQPVQTQKVESSKISQQSEKLESISSVDDRSVKTSKSTDIFGDQLSTEDDIFTSIKPISRKIVHTKSLFAADSDDDDNEFFGKPTSLVESKSSESKPIIKKSVTRDLKKTAEKIVEDPLSLFQDN